MIVLQYLRSLVFVVQMYVALPIVGLLYLPAALTREDGARRAMHAYSRYVRSSARWIVGLHSEVRGEVPRGDVMVAAKHQSFFDIIMLVTVLDRPRFVMKQELVRAPVLGWFALRAGCIPVERGKRGRAVSQMLREVEAGRGEAGQLVIYPQGTRVAPGVEMPYKTGAAVIYGALGQTCVPVAVNVGIFWPRSGVLRKPGTAVIEFLEPIPPGLPRAKFGEILEQRVETRSDALMEEAGWRRVETRADPTR